ncbi:acriflavine resistance protein B [Saccharobesus litoralis]|uniref:Acriflavine resistance protein B n=1 Tax=Saccharobesus litoralis TaxID=2172099 RepID=A0A2S0VMJ5_9ALTE|nr:efflux RND transporter permease subunit [Saccharobesus litoralis]AWB65402.1 acriflavine resistance protein B [Saccharobesus litoralis]
MNLTELAFRYRKVVLTILCILLINGVFAYFTMPAQEDPTITIREAIVSTSYPGMSPQRVENLITRKLEEQIRQIPEVKTITSSSATGLSTIHVKIEDKYFNLDSIWQDLRNKVEQAQSSLPQGTRPSFVNDEFGDVSVVTVAMTADGFAMADMYEMAKHVRDNIYLVNGTKKVDILGNQQQRIFLEVENAKLAQLGISPAALINELQSQNIISSGGEIDTGRKSFIVEPTGNFNSLEEISATHISIAHTQEYIALTDIVKISKGYIDPPYQPAYFNGQPALFIAIAMLPEFNILDYAPRIKAKLAQLEHSMPIGYQLNIATFQADQVEKTVSGVSINVLQTLAIVLVIVILFLGIRTGLIVGSIVPFVMLVTLSIMQMSGIKLERMSLATLIISLGLLVDNGIVIAEDFKRRLEEGTERYQAMIQGGKELALPLLSSSVTTILFFLPLMLAEHVAGEYTRSISLVILITLLSSWLLSLCVTPTLSYFFIKADNTPDQANKVAVFDRVNTFYESMLHTLLSHRAMFLVAMFMLLIFASYLMRFVPNQFFPDSDRPQIMINIDLPNGTSSKETNRQMQAIFTWLDNKPELDFIENYSGYVGFSGPRFVLSLNPEDPAVNKGFIVLNVQPGLDLKQITLDLDAELESQFPNISARVNKMFLGPSDSNTIKIQVKGPDKDVIYSKSQQIMDLLHQIPNTLDIRNNWENRIVKVEVQVDQLRARRAGVTSSDIALAMRSYFSGTEITQFREDDTIIPVIMRAGDGERHNLDRLRTLNIYSQKTGNTVPLLQVADFKGINQYSIIQREDMYRTVSVEARNTQMAAEDLKRLIDDQINSLKNDLPENHSIEYDGVVKESVEAQKALSASMPAVIAVILVLFIAQFNSFRKAWIIVLTIPLSLIGAVIGLLTMNAPFGFMVSLGLYSLAGIIINNAIVLIDRIDIERNNGIAAYQAIINASLTRLRPITMTTVTTMLGLAPLIISQDPLFYGMACVIAFGLFVGTLLTLGVVPVLYSLFYRVNRVV